MWEAMGVSEPPPIPPSAVDNTVGAGDPSAADRDPTPEQRRARERKRKRAERKAKKNKSKKDPSGGKGGKLDIRA